MKLAIQLLSFVFSCVLAQGAAAQAYPAKPVKVVVPFPPGGGVDTLARIVQPKLAEGLGQPVIVENKAGATGQIGVDSVAKSPADGYTVLIGSPGAMSVAPGLNPKLPYNPVRDLAPVTQGVLISNVLVINPSLPAKNVAELIALARSQPGRLTFASGGQGSSPHLSGELFKLLARVDILHVPYKGTAPALNDVVGGQANMFFSDPSGLNLVKAGKLRALAQTAATRSPSIPDLPTIAESGVPGYNATNWYGFFVPAGTPANVIARLNAELVKSLNAPEVKSKLVAAGMDPAPSTPRELGNFLKEDIARWAEVIKAAKVRLE
jgi:tripartite-type tricarboxylate transporter receptor subunit TctC